MSRVSSKEAAQLVQLLEATPEAQRSEGWPPLLTLLTRWAAQGPQARPARPWEQNTPATSPQQAALHTAHQQLLHRAADLVQACLLHVSSEAQVHPSGSAAAALGQLFVPSVLFVSAVLTADKTGQPGLQQAAVAATCEAAAVIAAAPAALLPATGQTGLPAVLSSCRAVLLACKGNPSHAAWLIACLLSALHTAVPGIVNVTLQQQQDPLQQQYSVNFPAAAGAQYSHIQGPGTAAHGGSSSSSRSQQDDAQSTTSSSWLQEQLQQSAACTVLPLVSGLYSLGHDFGLSCCQTAAATGQLRRHVPTATAWRAAEPAGVESLDSNARNGSSSSSSSASTQPRGSSVIQALQEVGSVLVAACRSHSNELLLGLAAAVAAGMCAGVIEGLPPAAAAAGAAAMPPGLQGFAAAADAAWGSNMQHSRPRVEQRPRATQLAADSTRWQLLEQAEVLQQALRAACACCMVRNSTSQIDAPTQGGVPTADTVATAVGRGLLGQAFGRLMSGIGHLPGQLMSGQHSATAQQQQQQQQPQELSAEVAGLSCTLLYLADHCCSLSGVFHHAAGRHDAAAAGRWLLAQQQQHPAQEVGTLTRWLAGGVRSCSGQELLHLLAQLRESGVRLARSYGSYHLSTPSGVAAALDAAAVRQQLDLNFAVHVALLSEIWQACNASAVTAAPSAADSVSVRSQPAVDSSAGSSEYGGLTAAELQAAAVAQGLGDLAALQFCRVQLPVYMDLLRALVTSLASSSAAADAFMSATLPCYERLIQPHPAATSSASSGVCDKGSSGAPVVPEAVWLQDTVTAAEVTFLLPLLPVAVRAASDAAAAAQRVLPLLLLLLPHPVAAVAQAAHAAFAGLQAVAAAAEQELLKLSPGQVQQQPAQHDVSSVPKDKLHARMPLPHQQQQQQQQQRASLVEIVQHAVPMYLQRSMAALPGHGSLEGLSSSYYSLLKNLPTGSAIGQFCVKQVAARALELVLEAGVRAAAARQDGDEVALHAVADQQQAQQGQQQHPVPTSAAAAPGELGLGAVQPNSSDFEVLAAAANKLFELLVLSVQLGDYQLLPSTLQQVADCVKAAPVFVQGHWLSQLYAGCLAIGDYIRKPRLMVWMDQLQKQVLQQHTSSRVKAVGAQAEQQGQHWQDTAGQH